MHRFFSTVAQVIRGNDGVFLVIKLECKHPGLPDDHCVDQQSQASTLNSLIPVTTSEGESDRGAKHISIRQAVA